MMNRAKSQMGAASKFAAFVIGIALMVGLSSTEVGAVESAGYFRVWQGFRKADLTEAQFQHALPQFMKDTVDLYGDRALNQYLVVLPPKERPAFIPDELALVALSSQEDYQAIRATPEGQAYSARHWDVFEKTISKSAPFVRFADSQVDALQDQTAYDILGQTIDWTQGATFAFIGVRKADVAQDAFLSHLKTHVELARDVMAPRGLRGYIIIAAQDYEVAFLNWESKAAHDAALGTKDGQGVFADAQSFMNVLMYEEARLVAPGTTVSERSANITMGTK